VSTVLLLHGFPQTSHAWSEVVGPLREAGHDVLAPDLFGAHLVEQALDLLDEPAHVVGHDIGAQAAWRLAATHPDRVRSLTAISAPHPVAFARAVAGEDGSDQARRSFYLDHLKAPAALDLFLAEQGAGLRRLFAASNHTGDVDAHVRSMLVPGVLDRALGWYRAERPAEVDDIDVPTLYVWGTEDTVVGPHAAAFTADHVHGPYRFAALEGAGHWIPELDADRLVPLVLEHVAA
jgi:pimeloyl-ACP methyl ester carboxylesterase